MNAISRRIRQQESTEVKDTDTRILDYQRQLTLSVESLRSRGLITEQEYNEAHKQVGASVRQFTQSLRDRSDRKDSER